MVSTMYSDNNFKKEKQCIKLDFAYNRNNRGIDSNNGFQKREFYTQRGVVLVTRRIKITKKVAPILSWTRKETKHVCLHHFFWNFRKKENQIKSKWSMDLIQDCVEGYKSQLDEVILVTNQPTFLLLEPYVTQCTCKEGIWVCSSATVVVALHLGVD